MHFRMISGIPGLYSLDAGSKCSLWQPKMSLNIAKHPAPFMRNTALVEATLWEQGTYRKSLWSWTPSGWSDWSHSLEAQWSDWWFHLHI